MDILRTAFDLPYTQITESWTRGTPEDCRQLHHRATSPVPRRSSVATPPAGPNRRRLLNASFAAARDGDLATLTGLVAADATAWRGSGGRGVAGRAARSVAPARTTVARFYAGSAPRRVIKWR